MNERYVLSPRAAANLVRTWRYLKHDAGEAVADRVESAILRMIAFLAENPGPGHIREDLTDQPVKFYPVHSWLIVYRPDSKPLQVIFILHSSRDVASLLKGRIN